MGQVRRRLAAALLLLVALSTAWVVLALASAPAGTVSPAQTLLVAGVGAVLLAGLALAPRPVPVRVGVSARAVDRRREADAPTPYWCRTEVPRRPARPRAPGER